MAFYSEVVVSFLCQIAVACAAFEQCLCEGDACRYFPPHHLFYCEVSMYEDGKKYDYVIPADEKSASVLKNACESYGYEEHEDYILFKTGLGRKSKFVPGLTNYLGSYPHE